MARQTLDSDDLIFDGEGRTKINANFAELYTTHAPRVHESPYIQQDGIGAFYNLATPFTSGGATITGGGASGARAARVYTCSAGSQRAFDTITRTVKGGQWYTFAVQVDAISGTLAQNVVALQTTPTIGASSITHTEVNAGGAGKIYAIRFMFDNDTSLAIRIGLGTATNESGALGLTLDYPMLCTIDGPTGVPPEHPLGMGTVVYDYENPNYYNPATKILTRGTAGTRYPIQRGHSVVCIADSFGTEPTEFAGVLRDQHRREVHVMAVAGATLTNFATYLDTWITNKPAFGNTSVGWTEGYQGLFTGGVSPSVVVFCSGINDIIQGATLAQMQARISALAATCVANGLVPVFTTTAPFGNFVSWTSGLQSVADAWNAWLLSSASGVVAVDIYSPLEDPANPDDLLAIYDSGDGLHPNATAHSVVVAPAIDRVLQLISRNVLP